jgi:hypothetical protein
MQQLSLLEEPPPAGAAPVWQKLDEEQRAVVVRRLARLIAKAVVEQENKPEPEVRHEP